MSTLGEQYAERIAAAGNIGDALTAAQEAEAARTPEERAADHQAVRDAAAAAMPKRTPPADPTPSPAESAFEKALGR